MVFLLVLVITGWKTTLGSFFKSSDISYKTKTEQQMRFVRNGSPYLMEFWIKLQALANFFKLQSFSAISIGVVADKN